MENLEITSSKFINWKSLKSTLSSHGSKSLAVGIKLLPLDELTLNLAIISLPSEGEKTNLSAPNPPSIRSLPGPPVNVSFPKKKSETNKS